MTKAEERKILEQIVDLIQSTPMDSYIRSAFSGVPEYAVRNIEDDAAYNPVEERDMWESRFNVESREHDRDKKLLSDAQKMCREALDSDAEHGKRLLEVEHERDVLRQTIDFKDAEIATKDYLLDSDAVEMQKLKAEIVRLRMQNMTNAEIAELYDKTKGAN